MDRTPRLLNWSARKRPAVKEHSIEGRAALLAHAQQMTPLSSARIVAQTTDGDGDMAAALGSASWVNGPRDSGGTTSRVRFLIVWRREADGRWRIARELLNADV